MRQKPPKNKGAAERGDGFCTGGFPGDAIFSAERTGRTWRDLKNRETECFWLFGGVCPAFNGEYIDEAGSGVYGRRVHFRTALRLEFRRRVERNRRYSLRAFARDLGSDHATLSQILRGRRRLSPSMVRQIGARLRLAPSIVSEAAEQQSAEIVLRLAQAPGFCVQSRWIATRTGLPLDAVNIAIHRLLRNGDLVMESSNCWKATRPNYA